MDFREIDLVSAPQRPYIQKLIKELLKAWSTKKVNDHYQNYFLAYLDTLPRSEAEEKISHEIKLTLKNNSHFFKIQQARQAYEQTFVLVKDALADFKNSRNIPDSDLKLICMLLDKLRSCKLEVAEATLALNYECLQNGSEIAELIQGNNYIFQQLNDDNSFFQESILSKYIHFCNKYDPFFIYHYQMARKAPIQSLNSYVDSIFNLTITKAYKYMKTQQEIIQFLSGKVPSRYSNKKSKRMHYQFIDEKRPNFTKQKMSNRNIFRLQNNIYVKERSNTEQTDFNQFHRTKTQASPESYLRYIPKPISNKSQHTQVVSDYKLPKIDDIRKTTQTRQSFQNFSPARSSIRKYSQEVDQSRKYVFKIRRKSIKSNSPITKRNIGLNNRNIFDMDQQNNSYKYRLVPIDDFEKVSSEKNSIQNENLDIPQIDQNQDSNMEDPLSQKITNISSFKLRPVVMDPPTQMIKSNVFGNFKLKASNMKFENIFIFLKELNINESYRNIFQTGSWKTSIENNQYYLHKFYLDDILQAVSLCCALPQGDILIKYWAPMKSCNSQKSHYLFKKYLEHIQKSSISDNIYFNGFQMKQIISNDFLKQKERIYKKARSYPKQIDPYNYSPFLTLNFSIIAVPKSIQKSVLQSIILKSNKNVPFNEKQFICFNYLLITNKIQNLYEGGFSGFSSYSPNISNFKQVETKLIKQGMTECPYNTNLNIPDASLMTIRLRTPVFSAFFIANNPYLKLLGDMIYEDQESLIVSLQLLKHNTKLYFGKGFKEVSSMISVIKAKPNTPQKKINYCVRMFSKRMRGKLSTISLRDHYCFSDFEVVFEWIDFLKGKIEHNFNNYELFGDEEFFCIVEIQKQLVLGFMVNKQNFL